VFLLAEGQAQFTARVAAQAEAVGVLPPDLDVYLYRDPIDFTDSRAVLRILEELREIRPALVVVDSVVSHDPGTAGGQSDTATQAAAFGGMNTLALALGCLVLAVDHPGHNDKTRPAGSFAKLAKADAAWRMFREPKSDNVVLAPAKSKDFALPRSTRLRLRVVGAPNGAPLLVACDTAPRPEKLSTNMLSCLTVVSRLSETNSGRNGVTDRAWLQASITEGITRPTYYRTKTRLIDSGYVEKRGALHAVTASGAALVSSGITPVSRNGMRPTHQPHPPPTVPGLTPTRPPLGAGSGETDRGLVAVPDDDLSWLDDDDTDDQVEA
jgi:hypothetical protein